MPGLLTSQPYLSTRCDTSRLGHMPLMGVTAMRRNSDECFYTIMLKVQYTYCSAVYTRSNFAQMLRVPWSKARSIGDKILQVLRVLGVFRGSILRDTARTRSISGMNTLDTACTRSISGSDTAGTPCTPSIWGFSTAHTPSTPSIQAASTLILLSTRSTKCTRYSEYTAQSDCIHRTVLSFLRSKNTNLKLEIEPHRKRPLACAKSDRDRKMAWSLNSRCYPQTKEAAAA